MILINNIKMNQIYKVYDGTHRSDEELPKFFTFDIMDENENEKEKIIIHGASNYTNRDDGTIVGTKLNQISTEGKNIKASYLLYTFAGGRFTIFEDDTASFIIHGSGYLYILNTTGRIY